MYTIHFICNQFWHSLLILYERRYELVIIIISSKLANNLKMIDHYDDIDVEALPANALETKGEVISLSNKGLSRNDCNAFYSFNISIYF